VDASWLARLQRPPSPLVEFNDQRLQHQGLRMLLKRDDLIDPDLPGNKWRKLKGNLLAAAEQGYTTLLTFGGAYSNHLRATAAAGQAFGFATIGVVRGEEHRPLNPVLADALRRGMRLTYVDRTRYRQKHSPELIASLRDRWGDFYLIPEGGSNELAVLGCAELVAEIEEHFDIICCPVGTGGTLAGIAAGLPARRRAIGFSALKGAYSLTDEVAALHRRTYGHSFDNWHINFDYHCGGYAKRSAELNDFILTFERAHGITLDWIYVAKMMLGVFTMAEHGSFSPGTTLISVITGPATP
jgi:1-aminocyclopropane-1-carboxylate deaminase